MTTPTLAARTQRVSAPMNSRPEDLPALTRFVHTELPQAWIAAPSDRIACGNGLLCKASVPVAQCWANAESLREWMARRGHLKFAATAWIGRRPRLDQPTLWITDNWSGGYFHWIAEALCRLEMTGCHYDLRDLTLVLPTKYRRRRFVLESLKMFDIGHVHFLGEFERARCTRMIVPSHVAPSGSFREEILDRLRHRVIQYAESQPRRLSMTSDRVYLSRAKAGRRIVVNETELTPILKRHGFDILVPEDMDWITQIQVLSQASTLVSNHGAALTNMIAMRPVDQFLKCDNARERRRTAFSPWRQR